MGYVAVSVDGQMLTDYHFSMESNIQYHILKPANAHLLHGADVFDNPVDPAQLAAFVEDAGHELVFAMVGTRVVGMASGNRMLHPDKLPAFFINEVGVNEDMQRRGIGTALSDMLMNVARSKGYQGMWLATELDNIEARALYMKLDGRETEGIVVYDWDRAMDE